MGNSIDNMCVWGYGETFDQALNGILNHLCYHGINILNKQMIEILIDEKHSEYFLQIENVGWTKIQNSKQNGIYKIVLERYYNEKFILESKNFKIHHLTERGKRKRINQNIPERNLRSQKID